MVEQPVNPNISTDVKSKLEIATKILQGHKVLFIFLVISFAIACIVTVSLISSNRSKQPGIPKTDNTSTLNLKDIKTNKYISKAKGTSDPNKSATYYKLAYFTLSAEYDRNPTSEKREDLKNLGNMIKTKYPQEAQNMNLDIPCRVVSCGAVFSYSKGLSEIESLVEENKTFNPDVKKMILLNIKDAALAAEKKNTQREINSLSSVFTTFQTEWKLTRNTSIKTLAEKTMTLLKEIAPDFVSNEVEFFKL